MKTKIFLHIKKFLENDKTPILIGGCFLITVLFFFSNFNFFPIKICLILIFALGLCADKNVLSNPKIRFLFQILILFCLIYFNDLRIPDLRLDFLNKILLNQFFNLFFLYILRIAILLNGSNFIDGLNGLLIGYSILIFLSILYVSLNFTDIISVDFEFIILIIFSLLILFIFNILGLVYLGDNGSYLLALFISTYLIIFINTNVNLSPYFIASILWYPAFENFFSLLRRLKTKKKSLQLIICIYINYSIFF